MQRTNRPALDQPDYRLAVGVNVDVLHSNLLLPRPKGDINRAGYLPDLRLLSA